MKCSWCKFYEYLEPPFKGECRRYPPVVEPGIGIVFPHIDKPSETWCGEYVPASSEGGPE